MYHLLNKCYNFPQNKVYTLYKKIYILFLQNFTGELLRVINYLRKKLINYLSNCNLGNNYLLIINRINKNQYESMGNKRILYISNLNELITYLYLSNYFLFSFHLQKMRWFFW